MNDQDIGTTKLKALYDNLPDEIVIEAEGYDARKDNEGQAWEGDEHRDIGNLAFSEFVHQLDADTKALIQSLGVEDAQPTLLYNPKAETEDDKKKPYHLLRFQLSEALSLSPGEIVALAGDFFASPNPISFGTDEADDDGKVARFEAAFKTLFETEDNHEKIKKVVAHIEDDAAGSSPHSHWSVRLVKKPLDTTKALLDTNNLQYGWEMVDERSPSGFWHSPYFDLALRNFDHFGEEAKIAYLTGHDQAMKLAQEAGQLEDTPESQERKHTLLKGAFLRELYACHFLTDLFAAGHMRVPRKQLLNYVARNHRKQANVDLEATPSLESISSFDLMQAGFFARKMHDEDGDKGLYVHSMDKPDEWWQSFGDGNYYNEANQDNARRAVEVMQMTLEDILRAYRGEEALLSNHEQLSKYVPRPYSPDESRNQPKPMFTVNPEDNQLHLRGDLLEQFKARGFTGLKESASAAPLAMMLTGLGLFNVTIKKGNEAVVNVKAKLEEGQAQLSEAVHQEMENLQAEYDRLKEASAHISCHVL